MKYPIIAHFDEDLPDVGQPANESDAERAHRITHEILFHIGKTIQHYILAGGKLLYMKESKMYRQYGSHLRSWEDYVRELPFGRTTANNLRRVYKAFGSIIADHPELTAGLDITRLYGLLTQAEKMTEEDRCLLLHDAARTDTEGFENNRREAKGRPTTDDHEHEFEVGWQKCKICNKFRKVSDESKQSH